MRLYWVEPLQDSGWGVYVVAHNGREGKRLGWRACYRIAIAGDYEFTDCRVRWVRVAIVPAEITEPVVYEDWEDQPWIPQAEEEG